VTKGLGAGLVVATELFHRGKGHGEVHAFRAVQVYPVVLDLDLWFRV
jgi:hypothetical protein